MDRFKHLGSAAAAAAALGLAATLFAGSPARAFTIETLGGGSNGGATLTDPDDQGRNSRSGGTSLLGPNGPTVQFDAGQGSLNRFGPFQGFTPGPPPPDPYGPRSLGNND